MNYWNEDTVIQRGVGSMIGYHLSLLPGLAHNAKHNEPDSDLADEALAHAETVVSAVEEWCEHFRRDINELRALAERIGAPSMKKPANATGA